MNDKELLELAAKAAGIVLMPNSTSFQHNLDHTISAWNPLTDDGDALRLAVKLKMDVQTNETSAYAQTWQSDIGETKDVIEYFDPLDDPLTATRRAIVRAAAEIGKEMK